MSSDKLFARAFRLLASLLHLILENKNKRDLEMTCAALQKLVFDQTIYPTHKNWKGIGELKHRGLMFFIAGLTEDQIKSSLGQSLAVLFPQCFSEKPMGPIPWSHFLDCAAANPKNPESDVMLVRRNPISESRVLEKIDGCPPCKTYLVSEKSLQEHPTGFVWPRNLCSDVEVGAKIQIDDDCWWQVVEHQKRDGFDEITVMPAGSIDFYA